MSTEYEREANRLWRAWRTVHEMCRDRGYELLEEEVDIPYEEFKSRYIPESDGIPSRTLMTFQANPSASMLEKYTPLPTTNTPDPEPQCGPIWVEFAKSDTIGVKQITEFMTLCRSKNYHTGLLVTRQALSGPALRATAASDSCRIETFREQDLLINITKHVLVPKHVLLSPAEKKALLDRYRLKETQLPRIQSSDAVARYLGLRRGEVVKIIRSSVTAGRYASYRWCV